MKRTIALAVLFWVCNVPARAFAHDFPLERSLILQASDRSLDLLVRVQVGGPRAALLREQQDTNRNGVLDAQEKDALARHLISHGLAALSLSADNTAPYDLRTNVRARLDDSRPERAENRGEGIIALGLVHLASPTSGALLRITLALDQKAAGATIQVQASDGGCITGWDRGSLQTDGALVLGSLSGGDKVIVQVMCGKCGTNTPPVKP